MLEIGQIFVLDVDLQRRQDAHHGAVEGNRQDQVGEALGVEFFAQVREGGVGNGQFRRHFTGRLEHGFGQRLQIGGAALRLGGDGADVVVADAEIVADLDVMGILVGRSGNIADLKDGELAQPRIELGTVADVVADAAPAARGARTVDQSAKQIDRAVEQILMLGRQIRAIEIGNACHLSFAPFPFTRSASPPPAPRFPA